MFTTCNTFELIRIHTWLDKPTKDEAGKHLASICISQSMGVAIWSLMQLANEDRAGFSGGGHKETVAENSLFSLSVHRDE